MAVSLQERLQIYKFNKLLNVDTIDHRISAAESKFGTDSPPLCAHELFSIRGPNRNVLFK